MLLVMKSKESVLSSASKNVEWYDGTDLMVPMSHKLTNYTWLGFELTPMMGAIGWFMRFRVALLVSLGTFFTWFVVTPLAYHCRIIHSTILLMGTSIRLAQFDPVASIYSYSYVARPMAIGAILEEG